MVRNQLLDGQPFDDVLVRRIGQVMHANGLRGACGPDRQDAHAGRIDALGARIRAAFVRSQRARWRRCLTKARRKRGQGQGQHRLYFHHGKIRSYRFLIFPSFIKSRKLVKFIEICQISRNF
jgi:hypothetical protein